MDHPCYKCGHSIEDGKPFCPQCGAPQIRVAMPEASLQSMSAGDGAIAEPSGGVGPASLGIPASSLSVSWTHALKPCALAAAIAVALQRVGLNPFVGALAAGFLAAAFTRRRISGTVMGAGAGARLGVLSGLLLFAMSTIPAMFALAMLHKGAEIRSQMMEKLQQVAARYPGPETQPFLDFVRSPDGFAIMMVASVIFALVAFVVLGGLGGALGAALLGRNDRP
jgi:hypothetical protein